MSRKIGVCIWLLGVTLSMILFFCFAREINTSFWIGFGFVILAFLSSFIFQLIIFANPSLSRFISLGSVVISYFYMLVQIPVSIIFAVFAGCISNKIAILINSVLFIVFWILILSGLTGNQRIQKVERRQKNHHIEL